MPDAADDRVTAARAPAAAVVLLPHAGLGGVTRWAELLRDATGASIVVGPDPDADFAATIRATILAARGRIDRGERVVLLPQLGGAVYAAACAAAHAIDREYRDRVIVAGWMHTDFAHDVALLRRFAPALAAIGCTSRAARDALAAAVPIELPFVLPTGVFDPGPPLRPPDDANDDSPLRLAYAGRIERDHKRVLALPAAIEALATLGIAAQLEAIGDGPDRAAFDAALRAVGPPARRLPPGDPAAVRALFERADLALLPSRSEGLGLARIEGALAGAVPVVTRDAGGALEGLTPGSDAIIVDADRDDDEACTGRAIAAALGSLLAPATSSLRSSRGDLHEATQRARALRAILAPMGRRARDAALAHFDLDRFATAATEHLRRLAATPATPAHRTAWAAIATDPGAHTTFTVPDDARSRTRALLDRLDRAGVERILVYGGGAHLRAVRSVLRDGPPTVAAIIDDDPTRNGTSIEGFRVCSRDTARTIADVHDIVVCSWLHEDAMVRRAADLAAAGFRMHRIYAADGPGEDGDSDAGDDGRAPVAAMGRTEGDPPGSMIR